MRPNPARPLVLDPSEAKDETPSPSPPALSTFAKAVARKVGEKATTRPKHVASVSAKSWSNAKKRAEAAMQSGDWEGRKPIDFVASYAILHLAVFGVEDESLVSSPQTRSLASYAASKALRTYFEGDAAAMAEFVRWTWQRERWREGKRREEGSDGGRLAWKFAFGAGVVTDWRASRHRKSGKAREES